ncbi:DUF1120 domain-containing protein [Pseudomonas mandelii]|uniref:DUF1120 domain-containing protein n=1 Tax=Pseudomonas mandelii TaxID=75612 RepID=UPI00224B4A4C|nr:DUF1120 domain-containing protein [Pseudomonas mandelii]MCX2899822.1 DUF1120 domain-containing protein [Pseudomonas mandelii]
MIKRYLAALCATALIGVAPPAVAASTTELKVTGIITPAACVPTLSSGGIVDHGKISSQDLNQTKETRLAQHTLQFSVNCDSATVFTLKPIDNRPNTDHDRGELFGLGKINGDQRLGGFLPSFHNVVADGVPAITLGSIDNGNSWYRNSFIFPYAVNAVGSPADPSTPIAVKDLATDLLINTYIARADSLDLGNEVAIDGSTTLEIRY